MYLGSKLADGGLRSTRVLKRRYEEQVQTLITMVERTNIKSILRDD